MTRQPPQGLERLGVTRRCGVWSGAGPHSHPSSSLPALTSALSHPISFLVLQSSHLPPLPQSPLYLPLLAPSPLSTGTRHSLTSAAVVATPFRRCHRGGEGFPAVTYPFNSPACTVTPPSALLSPSPLPSSATISLQTVPDPFLSPPSSRNRPQTSFLLQPPQSFIDHQPTLKPYYSDWPLLSLPPFTATSHVLSVSDCGVAFLPSTHCPAGRIERPQLPAGRIERPQLPSGENRGATTARSGLQSEEFSFAAAPL